MLIYEEVERKNHMANYLIGMHNIFDENKYNTDYKEWFYGIEFCNLNEEQINKVLHQQERKHFRIGIHFPLIKTDYLKRDPLIFSKDAEEAKMARAAVEREMAYAERIRARYMLIHFPKPMILNHNLSWDKCKFHDYEHIDENEYSFEVFKQRCEEVFNWLDKLIEKYRVPIILELEVINKYLYQGNLLKDLLEEHRSIKLCLDTARLHVLDEIDNEFNLDEFILKYVPYVELLHISNIQVGEKIENRHYPALESLCVNEGWADIKNILKIISQKNKELMVLFEHRSDLISRSQLDQCYEWITQIFDD